MRPRPILRDLTALLAVGSFIALIWWPVFVVGGAV